MSAQPTIRDPYYGERRASPAPQRYRDQAYSDYGSQIRSKSEPSVDQAILSGMDNLRIGDDQTRSNSMPITNPNLLHATTPQRVTSQRTIPQRATSPRPRPRPNQKQAPPPPSPQYEPEYQPEPQEEYRTYNYQ